MDSYTKVTRKGYGSRIMDSIKGIFFGFLLFIASFFVLWINEGSVDMSKIAKTSIEVDSLKVDSINNEKLISVSGEIISDEIIGDNLYLKPGKYIAVSRNVEMYSWVETTSTDTDTNVGGSETTTTTYEYSKKWTNSPANSDNFEIREGHQNPEMRISSSKDTVNNSNIGEYNIKASNISLPYNSTVKLTKENTITDNSQTGGIVLSNGYLFNGKGSFEGPNVGDIRISYNSLNSGASVTAMGKQDNENLVSFSDKNGNTLFRVFNGTRDDAISTLRTEYLTKLWLLRALGFVLMWIGLSMLFGPISVLLDVLPIAGSISRGIIGIITFIVAFVLSLITIIISIIFHNVYVLIGTVIIIGFLLLKYLRKKGDSNVQDEYKEEKRKDSTKKEGSMIDFDTE